MSEKSDEATTKNNFAQISCMCVSLPNGTVCTLNKTWRYAESKMVYAMKNGNKRVRMQPNGIQI